MILCHAMHGRPAAVSSNRETARRCLALTILLGLLCIFSGCAGTIQNMREVEPESALIAPGDGKAVVVFMRPAGLGYNVQASVFELIDDAPSLIGIVAARTKVAHAVDPGRHLFMVVGENADFMTAELEAGKVYYAIVAPRIGMWKARFAFEPVRRAQLETWHVKTAEDMCKLVEKTAASDDWAQQNMSSIVSRRTEFYPDWLKQPEEEKPALLPQDGR
jgi:hypothetical protein